MRDRPFTILSTSLFPAERIPGVPANIDIQIIPFTEILPRDHTNIQSALEEISAKPATVIFTSAQAVKIVAGLLKNKPAWKIYCIRNETRIAVVNWFGSDSVANFASNAQTLSQSIIHDGVKEAVFFCGDQRMDILPDNLRKHGIELTELIVYETQLTPVPMRKLPDAILFFSPTAVRSFFSLNKLTGETRIFAMGKTTAAALHEVTEEPVIISPEADKAFVLNMAIDYAVSHSTI